MEDNNYKVVWLLIVMVEQTIEPRHLIKYFWNVDLSLTRNDENRKKQPYLMLIDFLETASQYFSCGAVVSTWPGGLIRRGFVMDESYPYKRDLEEWQDMESWEFCGDDVYSRLSSRLPNDKNRLVIKLGVKKEIIPKLEEGFGEFAKRWKIEK